MQGFPFYEKPMRITYAKGKSDASAKLDGSYQAKDKAERAAKRKAEREERKEAKKMGAMKQKEGDAGAAATASTTPSPAVALPNAILFVENLPDQVNEMMLSMLFQQFPGYKEVRLVPGKAGIAFVEFDGEMQSGVAMSGLQSFKIT